MVSSIRADSDTAIEIQAFTADRVRTLTGLSARQLQYWDERGFIGPSLTTRKGRGRKRLYSFPDLVALKVASQLRKSVSLQLLRRVADHLRELNYSQPLAEVRFFVVGDRLLFREAEMTWEGRQPTQSVAEYTIPVPAIAAELAGQIALLRQRPVGEIEKRRGALGGQPLIKGTRIPVAAIHRLTRDGADRTEILALYPDLDPADLDAALAAEIPRRSRAS
jgi:uncharacterized protein (DUF433 family)